MIPAIRRFAGCVAVFAALCGQLLSQDRRWLEAHELNDRYEGIFDLPNAKSEATVLAFFGLAPGGMLSAEKHSDLHVKYYVPGDETVYIHATETATSGNYVMRTKPGHAPNVPHSWNEFQWPVDHTINPYDIDPKQIGVVVSLNQDSDYSTQLAPALFFSRPPPRAPITRYELLLLIDEYSLDNLGCTAQVASASRKSDQRNTCYYTPAESCAAAVQHKEDYVAAGSIARICLDMGRTEPGEAMVRLQGKHHKNADSLKMNFYFYHEP